MNNVNQVLLDALKLSELYLAYRSANNSLNSDTNIIDMLSQLRAKLKLAMEHSSTMFESHMQCIAHVIALKREKAANDQTNLTQIKTLHDRVNSLLNILETTPASSSNSPTSSAFEGLKGLWRKLLVSNSVGAGITSKIATDPAIIGDRERFEEHSAVALSLLTTQCVQEVYGEYEHKQANSSIADKTSSFIFLRLLDKVTRLCESLGSTQQEVNLLARQNDQLRRSAQDRAVGAEGLVSELREAHRRVECGLFQAEEQHSRQSDLARQLRVKENTVASLLAQSLRDRQKVESLERQLAHMTGLYKSTMALCTQWKDFCESGAVATTVAHNNTATHKERIASSLSEEERALQTLADTASDTTVSVPDIPRKYDDDAHRIKHGAELVDSGHTGAVDTGGSNWRAEQTAQHRPHSRQLSHAEFNLTGDRYKSQQGGVKSIELSEIANHTDHSGDYDHQQQQFFSHQHNRQQPLQSQPFTEHLYSTAMQEPASHHTLSQLQCLALADLYVETVRDCSPPPVTPRNNVYSLPVPPDKVTSLSPIPQVDNSFLPRHEDRRLSEQADTSSWQHFTLASLATNTTAAAVRASDNAAQSTVQYDKRSAEAEAEDVSNAVSESNLAGRAAAVSPVVLLQLPFRSEHGTSRESEIGIDINYYSGNSGGNSCGSDDSYDDVESTTFITSPCAKKTSVRSGREAFTFHDDNNSCPHQTRSPSAVGIASEIALARERPFELHQHQHYEGLDHSYSEEKSSSSSNNNTNRNNAVSSGLHFSQRSSQRSNAADTEQMRNTYSLSATAAGSTFNATASTANNSANQPVNHPANNSGESFFFSDEESVRRRLEQTKRNLSRFERNIDQLGSLAAKRISPRSPSATFLTELSSQETAAQQEPAMLEVLRQWQPLGAATAIFGSNPSAHLTHSTESLESSSTVPICSSVSVSNNTVVDLKRENQLLRLQQQQEMHVLLCNSQPVPM